VIVRRRVVVGLVMPFLLVTAACSGSDGSAPVKVGTLQSVKVSGSTSAYPVVSFKAPIKFTKTASKVIVAGPGTGPAINRSSLVTVQYVGINATDANPFGMSWSKGTPPGLAKGTGPTTFYVNSVVKGFTDGLIGKHAGDRVLICVPAQDAFGSTGNLEATVRPGDSVVFVVDVMSVAPVEPHPDTVPSLQYDAKGNPSKFTAGDNVTKNPTKLGVYPVIKGTGPVLKSGDRISVEYFGQLYPDKDVFNPWTGQPFDVQLGAGGVIKGWELGLAGQRVGSRLVLVVPPDLAYGKKGQPPTIPANSTLIFTIQILSVN
jgi:FKBP-type peptidyl-prolyl cis-trans isomerase